MTLSEKSRAVLSLIAEGLSYQQIVDGHSDITFRDIFNAAEEALRLDGRVTDHHERMALIKEKYRRAYEKWSEAEEMQLKKMLACGKSVNEIAIALSRQPSAIRSRQNKLGINTP